MNTMNISIREVESKKRILEEAVDTLNEEIAGLKAKEQMNLAAYKDKEEEHADLLLNAHEMKVDVAKSASSTWPQIALIWSVLSPVLVDIQLTSQILLSMFPNIPCLFVMEHFFPPLMKIHQ
eukprot:Seg81.18 transcript_id=Seg81.18/GoldUCD/mRNA.D3Y31 product="Kinesin heavy chain" protein_id=Seg81.18/GoldUCD/D3Y31